MRVFHHLIAVLLGLSLLGCASKPPRAAWTKSHGGLLLDDWQQRRLETLAQTLTADLSLACTYHVLNTSRACAYAWPDGSIYVSLGLMELLDDHELTAVVAHELGHLLADGHLTPPAGLHGGANPVDAEQAADAVAARLLARLNIPLDALVSALAHVAASEGINTDTQRAIATRIELLRAHRMTD